MFFSELSNILYRSFGKYKNLLILGDLNIDLSDQDKIPKSKKELFIIHVIHHYFSLAALQHPMSSMSTYSK